MAREGDNLHVFQHELLDSRRQYGLFQSSATDNILALAAIVLSACFKNNAAARYSIMYSSLLFLALLCVVSVAIQARRSSFLPIKIATPNDYSEQLLPQLDFSSLFQDEK